MLNRTKRLIDPQISRCLVRASRVSPRVETAASLSAAATVGDDDTRPFRNVH